MECGGRAAKRRRRRFGSRPHEAACRCSSQSGVGVPGRTCHRTPNALAFLRRLPQMEAAKHVLASASGDSVRRFGSLLPSQELRSRTDTWNMSLRLIRRDDKPKSRKSEDEDENEDEDDGCRRDRAPTSNFLLPTTYYLLPSFRPYYLLPVTYYLLFDTVELTP